LTDARESWLARKMIKEEKFSLMMKSASYSVTVSSPFLTLFAEKPNLKFKNPPLHVEIMK